MSHAPAARAPEASASKAWLRALEMTAKIDDQPRRIFPLVIEELGARFGGAPALIARGENLSHAALAAQVSRYARWGLSQGIEKGETVCLLMPNRPDYLAIWLGLSRIGAVVALINTNLTGAALAHCITVAAPRHIIVDARLDLALEGLETRAMVWRHGEALAEIISGFSGVALTAEESREVTLEDPALLIYTSGTTGLPKAAFVSHHRVMMWTHWFAGMMNAGPDDRLYNCLPMYHSVGGVVASGAVLLAGGAVILREKFSASRFWDDITGSGATIFQYIGELCRYLLNSPGDAPAHQLRLICGNGLSADVWEKFLERFSGPPLLRAQRAPAGEVAVAGSGAGEGRRGHIQVLEFYAATEGNFSLYNAEGKAGAIGRVPGFLKHRFGIALIKRNEDGAPLRAADGFCRRAAIGEAGEAIGRIAGGAARFEGYSDAAASARKILRNVFEPGDAYVRSGDLMRQDAQGFYYFVDRLGDTFRWKGENVATTEIAAVLGEYPGVSAATVYGVTVPGHDGKAGMAALETNDGFDIIGLKSHLATLPAYARPLFIRLVPTLAVTETFKPKKSELVAEGFDPARTSDTLYADTGKSYELLDAALYARINSGLIRF
jgi:fatty-acyl-CoA synthase